MKSEIGLILIPGAGLNKSIWNECAELCQHPVLMLQLPNRHKSASENTQLTLDDYVSFCAEQVAEWNCDRYIIVAHSAGALIGLRLAALFHHNVVGFMALAAIIPHSGKSFASALPFPQSLILPMVLRFFGTRPPDGTIIKELGNGLSESRQLQIVEEFTPESVRFYTDAVTYELPNSPRAYVQFDSDLSVPIGLQQKMASRLKADMTYIIAGGHLAMINEAVALNSVFDQFLRTILKPVNSFS